MSTSGSYNFSLTAAQIVARAARNLKILEAGQTIDSNDQTDLLQTLNVIAKEFQGTADLSPGMKVFTRQRLTLLLAKGQQTYLIGPASTDSRTSNAVGRTTIRAAEAAGQTILDVTALTDTTSDPGTTITMTASDIIGIQTDDSGGDDIFWSTISSTSSSGPTVTIASALPSGRPAASGNYVWWFTSRAQRFPVIESALLRDSNFKDTPLEVYVDARQYDQGVASKFADGTPGAVLVEPLRLNTRLTFNSQPTDVTRTIVLTVLYPSEDYDATTDDIAFPQEWYGFIEWELTLRSCSMFGVAWTSDMEKSYLNAMKTAKSLNPENSVLYFRPNA
jgi:hypothetical protein